MNDLPKLTVSYALDDGASQGRAFETEEQARRHHSYLRGDAIVVRLYVAGDGRIVHTETLEDAT